jgi:glutaminase
LTEIYLCNVCSCHRNIETQRTWVGDDTIALNDDHKPHNPLNNTGAINLCALIHPQRPLDERFDLLQNVYGAAAGQRPVGYSNRHYSHARHHSDRSYCLTYLMKEHGCFPAGVDAQATLEMYFMSNATMLDCKAIAILAGTLANGGVCPTPGERVFTDRSVRNCLSMMFSCGHGEFSGEFAFRFGCSAKSSRSGCTMIVLPGTCGFCVWSPKLDTQFGLSVRGIAVASQLVKVCLSVHLYCYPSAPRYARVLFPTTAMFMRVCVWVGSDAEPHRRRSASDSTASRLSLTPGPIPTTASPHSPAPSAPTAR